MAGAFKGRGINLQHGAFDSGQPSLGEPREPDAGDHSPNVRHRAAVFKHGVGLGGQMQLHQAKGQAQIGLDLCGGV